MKDRRWAGRSVLCPYYRFESAYCVYCEGLREGHLMRQSFPIPEEKRSFVRTFCANAYEKCIAFSEEAREAMAFWAEQERPREGPHTNMEAGQFCLWNPCMG